MRTTTFKRAARSAAVLTVPVAVAFMVSSGPATAADAGQLEVTTTIAYDYTIAETEDGNGSLGVSGEIPVFPAGDPSATLYGSYGTDTYTVGFEQDLTGAGGTTVYGEVYPADGLTLGIENTTNSEGSETTVYGDYATDAYGVGGEYNLTTGEGSLYGEIYPADGATLGATVNTDGDVSVYGSYETDDYSVGFNSDLGGDTTVYAETYPNENTTVGVDANLTTGESNAYGSTSVPRGDNATLNTSWEYGITDPAEAPVAP